MLRKISDEFVGVIQGVFQEGWIYIIVLISILGLALLAPSLDVFLEYLKEILILIWPVILGIILFRLCLSLWIHWRQEIYIRKLTKWNMLEIKIPREIRKNPKAMEQVFASLHGMRNVANNIREYYWDGEVTRWFSCEMVSFGGEIHFYIRFPRRYSTIVQNAFQSFYPEIEFEEAEDYARTKLPQTIQEVYAKDYDLWGADMTLRREGAYPIKTYEEFEAVAEEKEYDTMSVFLEVMGNIKKEEFVGIQFMCAPMGLDWGEKYHDLIEKLRRPKVEPDTYISPETGEEVSYKPVAIRTPGETEVLEAIERNLSKPAFETIIRFIYLSPKKLFHDTYPRRGIKGSFNQFNKLSCNGIELNTSIATRVQFWFFPYLFPGLRSEIRKQRALFNYIHRDFPPEPLMGRVLTSSPFDSGFKFKTFEMNTECLATLFHPPSYIALTAPHTKRVESKKMAPPAALPIYGSEEDIEKYL